MLTNGSTMDTDSYNKLMQESNQFNANLPGQSITGVAGTVHWSPVTRPCPTCGTCPTCGAHTSYTYFNGPTCK